MSVQKFYALSSLLLDVGEVFIDALSLYKMQKVCRCNVECKAANLCCRYSAVKVIPN